MIKKVLIFFVSVSLIVILINSVRAMEEPPRKYPDYEQPETEEEREYPKDESPPTPPYNDVRHDDEDAHQQPPREYPDDNGGNNNTNP